MATTTVMPAQIEIDHDRGVLYVHLTDSKDVESRGTITILRICGLPNIPKGVQAIDLTGPFERMSIFSILEGNTHKRGE